MHIATRPTRIAVLAVGYADGLPHRLSNRGRVMAAGKYAPILGAVSMDLTTIDVSESPQLRPGDAVTLIGSEGECSIDAQQLARTAGTISYSVLCGITSASSESTYSGSHVCSTQPAELSSGRFSPRGAPEGMPR